MRYLDTLMARCPTGTVCVHGDCKVVWPAEIPTKNNTGASMSGADEEAKANGNAQPVAQIGHNSGATGPVQDDYTPVVSDRDPGPAKDFQLRGPLELRKDAVMAKELEEFVSAICSQGNDGVRQAAITNAMHRARANPNVSHIAYRLAEQIASRCRWAHRYHSEPNEEMAHYVGLEDAKNLPRTLDQLCEESVLKRVSVPRLAGGRPLGFYTVMCTAADRTRETLANIRSTVAKKVAEARKAKGEAANPHHDGLQTLTMTVCEKPNEINQTVTVTDCSKPSPLRYANRHHDGHTVEEDTVEESLSGAGAPDVGATEDLFPGETSKEASTGNPEPAPAKLHPKKGLHPDTQVAFDAYVVVAKRRGLPVPRKPENYLPKVSARLRDGNLDVWHEMLAKLEASPFHCGENERNWQADLGWIAEPRNYEKLLARKVGASSARAGLAPNWWRDDATFAAGLEAADWQLLYDANAKNGAWSVEMLGPPPGDPGCLIPPSIIQKLKKGDRA